MRRADGSAVPGARGRDRGNAVLEFIVVAVGLMLPLVFGVIALAQMQSAVVGVSGAAEMAGRAYAHARSDLVGRFAAARSAAIAGRNHGLDIRPDEVRITCTGTCLAPGTGVAVSIDTIAHIGVGPLARDVPLHAGHGIVIDPFRQAPQ